MKTLTGCLLAALALGASSCRSVSAIVPGSLMCDAAADGRAFVGFYSFEEGQLTAPPADPEQVDLVYYFDGDDCAHGALMGHEDAPGYLYPVGLTTRNELAKLRPPTAGAETVAAIAPLSKDMEGMAFWVRTREGGFVLVRLTAVEEATHAELLSGKTPALSFEWLEEGASTHER